MRIYRSHQIETYQDRFGLKKGLENTRNLKKKIRKHEGEKTLDYRYRPHAYDDAITKLLRLAVARHRNSAALGLPHRE